MSGKSLSCPICNQGNLTVGRDCIQYFKVFRGRVQWWRGIMPRVGELENSWLECDHCVTTSDDETPRGKLLKAVFKRHEVAQYIFTHLTASAQNRAIRDYLKGWKVTHPDDSLSWAEVRMILLDNQEQFYNINGRSVE